MSRIDRWPARAGVAACAAAMAMAPCVAQGTGRTLALVGTPGIGQTLTITETFPAPQSGKLNLWIVARPFAGAVPTPTTRYTPTRPVSSPATSRSPRPGAKRTHDGRRGWIDSDTACARQ